MGKEVELFNRSRTGVRVVYDESGVPIEIRPGARAKVTLADVEAKRFQELAESGDDLQLADRVSGADEERAKAAAARSEMEEKMDERGGRFAAERPYLPRVDGAEQLSKEEEEALQERMAKRAEEEGLNNPKASGGGSGKMVNQEGPKPEAPKGGQQPAEQRGTRQGAKK